MAQQLIDAINQSGLCGAPVVTAVTSLQPFYPAEAYHQDYLQKHPHGYTCHYIRPHWILP